MSRLDYSKWDKLELSDDSDIEVHPNVDKRSFIKWKQEAIHMEREQRKQRIEQLTREKEVHENMLKQVQDMIQMLEKDNGLEAIREHFQQVQLKAQEAGAENITLPGGNKETPTTANLQQIMSSLTVQIDDALKNNSPADVTRQLMGRLNEQEMAVKARLQECTAKLDKEKAEASKKLTSENLMKETSNRTIISSQQEQKLHPLKPAKTKETKKEKVIETLNPNAELKQKPILPVESGESKSVENKNTPNEDEEEEDIMISSVEAQEFSNLKTIKDSAEYVRIHPYMISESVSDEIMGEAFTYQLKGDEKTAKRMVHQALLLQYCASMGKGSNGAAAFFAKLASAPTDPRALNLFTDDVENTYARIKTRCAEINAERENNATEAIQLQPLDESGTIRVNIPEEKDGQLYEAFQALPADFREALKTGELDKINKVLANMDVAQAEELINICDQLGLLQLGTLPEEEQ
ncbi:hypothetical protein BZG36_00916 [Bifiguratus adelaidae]|uniref:Hsp90 chaperone protein kinase-targeting subunit n=1 Tax=Bifiguratus adelaidae TaxID=1938954 RepID=A0A261Y5L3_9FUNG|nr:hypothetical protein BZG36_00916 [Bifiguratus adelaidae]